MSQDVDLQQQILQRTLQEVAHDGHDDGATPCVICLEPVSEPAIAVPCAHANFDFLCLVSWLEQRRNCPLCKSDVSSVKYDLEGSDGPKLYKLPPQPPSTPNTHPVTNRSRPGSSLRHGHRTQQPRRSPPRQQPDDPLLRRQHIYRHQLYSLRVGSNRLSQYRELNPSMFNQDETLVSRARKWIRRELRVFAFLNPESESEAAPPAHRGRIPRPGQRRLESRRGNNAEFLLEYIIAILRTVDIKGSAGQAEELLRDFLGRDNARLFLHELQSWLRSPYMALEDWDRNVQYPEPDLRVADPGGPADRAATPVYRGGGRGRGSGRGRGARGRGRVSKSTYDHWRPQHRGAPRDDLAQSRRLQYARDRYIPD